jgi:hypothetical protein
VSPGSDQHGADALRDDRDVLHREVVLAREMIDEGLHVADRMRHARCVAARTRRAAVAPRIPGEEVVFGQPQLVDQMRHAAGVLVAAMEEQDGAARGTLGRGPMAVEQVHTVVRAERALLARARENGSGGGVVHDGSANPRRTRLTIVAHNAATRIGMTYPAHPGRDGVTAIHSPSAPKMNARSLLPIGPS